MDSPGWIHCVHQTLLGFDQQQQDSADKRKRADRRRNKMTVRGGDVHAQEINGFTRGREAQARVGEHHDAERDEQEETMVLVFI